MPRIGTPEYYRQKYICLMMFTGFLFIVFYSYTLSNRGQLIADISLIGGCVLFVLGIVLLLRERIKVIAP